MSTLQKNQNLAYIIGVALGDGNLSNPNGRAVRLRVTCDKKYPALITRIETTIQQLLPTNKVSRVNSGTNYLNISCYSNLWEKWLGWYVGKGSKIEQNVGVPTWIKHNDVYSLACLRGLFETDGSVYIDRGYLMTNFTTVIPRLANEVQRMLIRNGFKPHLYVIASTKRRTKYVIRISKEVPAFLNKTGILKN